MVAVLLKASLAALLSLAATLLICFLLVPRLGGEMAGAGLLMSIVCPVAVAFPASAVHFWQARKLREAHALASQTADELQRAYQLLTFKARIDDLTGVLNRSAFLDDLREASARGDAGSLFFVDLDHFKRINDFHGHAVGDAALSAVGRALNNYLGEGLVGRLGGEEFAAFCPDIDAASMAKRADQLCTLLASVELFDPEGRRVPISASVGATYCKPHFVAERSLALADANLYRAKESGRQQAVSL